MNLNIKTTMITLNDVINFIQKAIDKNLEITVNRNYISIYKSRFYKDCFEISFDDNEEKIILYIDCFFNDNGYKIILENNEDILKWKLFIENIKHYYHNCIENKFYNFFKEDDNKPVDINDLDDEEDK